MFPTQTSLIPVTVSLLRFVISNGFNSFNVNYPFWYLGTTPFKYLIGPVLPGIFLSLKSLSINVSLFDITIYLIILSFVVSLVGWILLISKITKTDKWIFFIIPALIFVILPWKYLAGFTLDEGTSTLAKNFLPWVLIGYFSYLDKKSILRFIIASLLTAFIFLINSDILPILFIGIIALCVSKSFNKEKKVSVEKLIKRALYIFLVGFIISTIWYGPNYWFTILSNPSIGGVIGIKVIFKVFDFLKIILPIFIAFLVVKVELKNKDSSKIFGLVWLLTFSFLSLYRFMADPDFWQDWTAWMSEVELGIWLIFSSDLILYLKKETENLKLINILKKYLFIVLIPFFVSYLAFNKLGKPVILSKEPPIIMENLEKLAQITQKDRVFLSGSTVFWANSLFDIYQIRGGRDQVSKDIVWREAAYTFREGRDLNLIRKYLKDLKVSYILVHTDRSLEYYKDFKEYDLWGKVGINVFEANGDIIYKI